MSFSNYQKRKKFVVAGLDIASVVGCVVLFTWGCTAPGLRGNTTTAPTIIQTATQQIVVEATTTSEVVVAEKPTIAISPIESISSSVFVYEGIEEEGLAGSANILPPDGARAPAYTLDYHLPENNQDAYVRLAFSFDQVQDLSDYGFVQMTIDFGGPDTSCEFYIKDTDDITQIMNQVSLSPASAGEGASVFHLGESKYTFTIPLQESFPGTNFSTVSEIGFSLETPSALGDKQITFSEIQFLSP